jgi:hypothetical protein
MPERDEDLVPARMLNEWVYCPRLFHFMPKAGATTGAPSWRRRWCHSA